MIDIIAPGFQSIPTLIPSMLSQTDPDWRLTILHDGLNDDWLKSARQFPDSRITIGATHKRAGVWGHNIRQILLDQMEDDGDYVVISNHDNYYLPNFIKSIQNHNEDMLSWSILHNYFNYTELIPKIQFGQIDIMSVAVKKDIAKKIGWKSFDNPSDWLFVRDCYQESKSYKQINQILGIHN